MKTFGSINHETLPIFDDHQFLITKQSENKMKTLFVDAKATELRYQGSNVLVYLAGKRTNSIPVEQLERIVVSPHVILTAGVLGVIAEKQVGLLVLNSRIPARTASLVGHHRGDIHRRIAQYRLVDKQQLCLTWSIKLVLLKIKRQRQLLTQAMQKRPELRLPLFKAITQLNRLIGQLTQPETILDLASLRGIEGIASAVYFKAYVKLFSSTLNLMGRNRNPPQDPVNAILSLSYTLLHQEAVNAIKTVGLDPTLGFYHQPYYGRDSLACDLIEPLRPVIDAWVWRLFAEKHLAVQHFEYDQNACLLNDIGKKYFYKDFYEQIPGINKLLRRYARFMAKIVGDS